MYYDNEYPIYDLDDPLPTKETYDFRFIPKPLIPFQRLYDVIERHEKELKRNKDGQILLTVSQLLRWVKEGWFD